MPTRLEYVSWTREKQDANSLCKLGDETFARKEIECGVAAGKERSKQWESLPQQKVYGGIRLTSATKKLTSATKGDRAVVDDA
jgi:hypothetical protein